LSLVLEGWVLVRFVQEEGGLGGSLVVDEMEIDGRVRGGCVLLKVVISPEIG
jgi:hypothetical protein